MAEIDDGGPAFPCTGEHVHSGYGYPGMSLRDYLAAHVEHSDDMSLEWAAVYAKRPPPAPRDGKAAPAKEYAEFWAAAMAGYRYAIADAMIAARRA